MFDKLTTAALMVVAQLELESGEADVVANGSGPAVGYWINRKVTAGTISTAIDIGLFFDENTVTRETEKAVMNADLSEGIAFHPINGSE